jgi:carbamate kinase
LCRKPNLDNRTAEVDVLGAETESMIGYMIEQELENALGHDQPVATLLTQVIVDARDPAFGRPTKFVGPVYERQEAETRAKAAGWTIAADGAKWRRVVASPKPMEIPDLRVLKLLLDQGVIVICAGGGGIPVVRRGDGSLIGIEAVIDKDAASVLLAREIGADALLLLTDVDGVYRDFGTERAARIAELTVVEARAFDAPAGSMGPKLRAGSDFATAGRFIGIGRLEDLTSPRALVIRGGERLRIAGREVARGDLIVLAEGDRVPADAVLREATGLTRTTIFTSSHRASGTFTRSKPSCGLASHVCSSRSIAPA